MAGVDVNGVNLVLVEGARAANISGPTHTEVPPPQPLRMWKGERITISGTITSVASGPVDLDVGRVDEDAPGGMINEGKHIFRNPVRFPFEVPVNIGDLRLAVFQDLEKDGPSDQDPYADVHVRVKGDAIEGLGFDLEVVAAVKVQVAVVDPSMWRLLRGLAQAKRHCPMEARPNRIRLEAKRVNGSLCLD